MRRGKRQPHFVSIPNGMEFYIALLENWMNTLLVSIPNGMEFYAAAIPVIAATARFNSQRDGILHKEFGFKNGYVEFQFPTGWNSTRPSFVLAINTMFQFPTGWNSTYTLFGV